jgi:hypothetical protein
MIDSINATDNTPLALMGRYRASVHIRMTLNIESSFYTHSNCAKQGWVNGTYNVFTVCNYIIWQVSRQQPPESYTISQTTPSPSPLMEVWYTCVIIVTHGSLAQLGHYRGCTYKVKVCLPYMTSADMESILLLAYRHMHLCDFFSQTPPKLDWVQTPQ